MITRIRIWMLKCMLRWHTYSDRISSGREDYDCYWVYLTEPADQGEKKRQYIISDFADGGAPDEDQLHSLFVRRMRQDESEEKHPAQLLTPEFMRGKGIEIEHAFKRYKLDFRSVESAFLWRLLLIEWGYHLYRLACEKVLDLGPRPGANYIKVLKAVCDHYFETGNQATTFDVLQRINGAKLELMSSEYQKEAIRKCMQVLKSLVEGGELAKDAGKGDAFRPTGKALKTLTDWDNQENERNWQRRHSRQMLGITFIIGFGTLVGPVESLGATLQEWYETCDWGILMLVGVFITLFFLRR